MTTPEPRMTDTDRAQVLQRAALIEACAKEATPGPWRCWNGWGPVGSRRSLLGISRIGPDADSSGIMAYGPTEPIGSRDLYATKADAEFVATAREDVPWLIEQLRLACADLEQREQEIDELRAVLDRARGFLSHVDNGYCSICHSRRKANAFGRDIPSRCEREDCFSHVMDAALSPAAKTEETHNER